MSGMEDERGGPPEETKPGDEWVAEERALQEKFFKGLLSSLRSFNLYPAEHPACRGALDDFHAAASALLAEKEFIIVGVIGGEMVMNGSTFPQQALIFDRLTELFMKKELEKITIYKDVSKDDLKQFVMILGGETIEGFSAFNVLLQAKGVSTIKAAKLDAERISRQKQAARSGLEAAESDYQRGMEIVSRMNEMVRSGREIKLGEVSSLAKMLVRGVMENQSSVMAMLNIHAKDEYTATHCLDVAVLTLLQTEGLGFGDTILGDIATAGLLHDLGKLVVPEEILNKRGPLTDEEWIVMRKHPVWGAELVHGLRGASELAIIAAFEHHLKYDGTGYPQRHRPRMPAGISHMVSVADVYDAVRSIRPYQGELPPEKAASILQGGAGTSFHPLLVRRFMDKVGNFGIGGLVRLTSGEIALVVKNRRGDPAHPSVEIIADDQGRPVSRRIVDTSCPGVRGKEVTVKESLALTTELRDLLWERKG